MHVIIYLLILVAFVLVSFLGDYCVGLWKFSHVNCSEMRNLSLRSEIEQDLYPISIKKWIWVLVKTLNKNKTHILINHQPFLWFPYSLFLLFLGHVWRMFRQSPIRWVAVNFRLIWLFCSGWWYIIGHCILYIYLRTTKMHCILQPSQTPLLSLSITFLSHCPHFPTDISLSLSDQYSFSFFFGFLGASMVNWIMFMYDIPLLESRSVYGGLNISNLYLWFLFSLFSWSESSRDRCNK